MTLTIKLLKVGHSLGGAVAELDALMFTLNLPSTVHIKSQTYGTPRVGNPAYATFFDSKVCIRPLNVTIVHLQ